MKDLRQVIILAVVFIIMAVALFLQGGPTEQPAIQVTDVATPDPTAFLMRVFPDIEVIRIAAIRLYDPNTDHGITIFRDDDGQWQSTDIAGELNQEDAADIARTIVLMPYLDAFTLDNDTPISQYGFTSDGGHYFSIYFLTFDGEEHTVAIGNPADILINDQPVFYALVDDSPEMLLIYRGAINFLVDYYLEPSVQ